MAHTPWDADRGGRAYLVYHARVEGEPGCPSAEIRGFCSDSDDDLCPDDATDAACSSSLSSSSTWRTSHCFLSTPDTPASTPTFTGNRCTMSIVWLSSDFEIRSSAYSTLSPWRCWRSISAMASEAFFKPWESRTRNFAPSMRQAREHWLGYCLSGTSRSRFPSFCSALETQLYNDARRPYPSGSA